MSNHILDLLGAFVDGELHGGQFRKVDIHLSECEICREEYQMLQSLSITLRNAPTPEFPSPERFAVDVALRLPRKPIKPLHTKALETGWWLAPVGLIVLWIFISTTLLVSNLVTAAGDFGLLDSAYTWLGTGPSEENYSATLGQFGVLTGERLEWVEMIESFTRTTVTQIYWQISVALLYLGWLAIWWARHMREELGQPIDGGNFPKGRSRPTV